MSNNQWYYYPAGPFAGVYEVYAALEMSEQEPDLIGRTVKPDAMIAAAECGDWEAVEALQFHDALVTPPPAPFVEKTDEPNVWYTEPVTSADGDKIEGRITQNERGYVVHAVSELASGLTMVSNGVQFDSFRGALEGAGTMVEIELNRLNQQRAVEMGDETETAYDNPWDYDEDEARVKRHDRIAQLRRQIEQNEAAILKARRELEDLLGE